MVSTPGRGTASQGPRPAQAAHHRDRLRAGLGHRHRQDRHPRASPRRSTPSSASLLAGIFGEDAAAAIRILYGGQREARQRRRRSWRKHDIDGALVGGASLDAASFERIIRYKG
ncbi:MAG: triose-phosphate isomerase [Desulfomicrobium escambiense]|nr:triose-phosphate isomerase [Desulfomicrobium escambiense]